MAHKKNKKIIFDIQRVPKIYSFSLSPAGEYQLTINKNTAGPDGNPSGARSLLLVELFFVRKGRKETFKSNFCRLE